MKFKILVLIFLSFAKIYSSDQVSLGIDRLIESNYESIIGKKVIFFGNQASRDSRGIETFEILAKCDRIELVAALAPEHGYFCAVQAGKKVSDDTLLGIPIISLYGEKRKPDKEIIKKCDVVIADIQDIGVRSYTYISALFLIMQTCAETNTPIYILDRPNPLGGICVDGNIPDKGFDSYVCKIPTTYVHGLTVGEIAKMINSEGWLGKNKKCDLTVFKMNGWKRNMDWNETGLNWFPTSPNIPSVESIYGLASLGILGELSLASIGIGTTLPFRYIGSTEYDLSNLEKYFEWNQYGIKLSKAVFSPSLGKYSDKIIPGYILNFKKHDEFKPYAFCMRAIIAFRKIAPKLFENSKIPKNNKNMFEKVTGSSELFNAITELNESKIIEISERGIEEFLEKRRKYLLY